MSVKQVFNTSAELDYPTVLPTLDLDFANSKTLDPRITFTRASGGSYVGADGLIKLAGVNEARFDHNQNTGESLGLLIEESRTNLTTYSEQLDNARWAVSNFTLSTNTSNTNAPDGTNTAEQILETVTNSLHAFRNNNAYSISAGTVYTASIFVKSIYKQFVQLIFDDTATTNGGYVNFDLTSGTITASANYGTGASISGTIIAYSNSWYRISITSTAGTSATFARFSTNGITSGGSGVFPEYAGNTSNGYYLWGAQLEEGAFPTSYIPTVASTRTRAADNASITGKNFSEWYRQDEGSIFVNYKGKSQEGTSYERVYSINLNSTANVEEILLFNNIAYNPDRIGYLVYDNSVAIQSTTGTTGGYVVPSSSPVKTAMSYKTVSYAYVFNGGIVLAENVAGVPTVNTLDIGRVGAGSQLNGTIARLTYYPKRLTDAQLQVLTT